MIIRLIGRSLLSQESLRFGGWWSIHSISSKEYLAVTRRFIVVSKRMAAVWIWRLPALICICFGTGCRDILRSPGDYCAISPINGRNGMKNDGVLCGFEGGDGRPQCCLLQVNPF